MNRIRRPRAEYEALLIRKESEQLSYKQLTAETGIPESTLVLCNRSGGLGPVPGVLRRWSWAWWNVLNPILRVRTARR
jgi:hypothetical protein